LKELEISMTKRPSATIPAILTAEVRVPFKYSIVHGIDPSRRSGEYKAFTKALNLVGLVFETPTMEKDGFHLSFTESTYGRNSLELLLELGKQFDTLEILGQVEWYESRMTMEADFFIVGVSFLDLTADAMDVLRNFLRHAQSLSQ
jgi:hypothetical protein